MFPVDWPNYVLDCFSGAPLKPLPLRGQAAKVGVPGETGLISINTAIAGTGPIDLSAVSLFLRQVLVEADGAGELVRGPAGSPFAPLQLTAARGSRPNRATFKTPAGARPIVTVEVTNRDVKTGKLQVSLTVDRAAMPEAAQGCATGDTAVLRTRFIIDDGVHPPVPFNVEQPWRRNQSRLKTP